MRQLIIAVCLMFVASTVWAVDGIPCKDGGLCNVGDSVTSLIQCAGEPISKSRDESIYQVGLAGVTKTEERWIYSIDGFGYAVTIKSGKISSIEDLGRD